MQIGLTTPQRVVFLHLDTLQGTHTMKTEKKPEKINGGARPGSGRKRGSPNKKTAALQQAVTESGLTPLDYMLSVLRNEAGEPRERLNAANMAAPYIHAKLSSVELSGKDGGDIGVKINVNFD